MSDWGDIFYFSIISTAFVLSFIGLWFTAALPGIDRWSKRFFLIYFTVLLLCNLSDLTAIILHYYPVPSETIYTVLHLVYLFSALPMPMLTVYLLHCCKESLRSNKLLYLAFGLWGVFFVFIVIALFIDCFYYVTPDREFHRGNLYPVLISPLIAIMLSNLIAAIRYRGKLSRKTYLSFVIAMLPMTISLLVLLFFDAIPLFDICFVLSALSMYSFILFDQIEQNLHHQREIARQQQEIAHERTSVLVLQMRPHFIYNTLMSIYSLCNLDPQKARQVTKDFTDYLRKNFNAVASESTISFSTELEHTRAYLAVEQAQFEDMLVVEYDIEFTNFRLPSLTLQPIVENAVKHGMNPAFGPLQISIRTRHTDSGTEIIVEDTGPGFDLSDDSKPHTALKNIHQRLEMMCRGSMTIKPRNNGGTIVKMQIPSTV